MAPRTRLMFIRHGEVEAPLVGAFVGAGTDVALSEVGRHQAEAIGAFLEDAAVDAILTSPMKRTVQTAAPAAKALGLAPEVREPLREMEFGDWEGRSWDDIHAADPEFAKRWAEDPATIACPGGECADDFSGRVHEELHRILQEFEGRCVALFAHAGVNRAVLSHVLGTPYLDAFAFAQDYGCVNAAAWDPASAVGQVALVNFVPGPRSDVNGDGGRRLEE